MLLVLSRFFFVVTTLMLVACVGPTTPFGAIEAVKQFDRKPAELKSLQREPTVKFLPERQVLHDRFDFSIELNSVDPPVEDLQLSVTYNGHDIKTVVEKNAVIHRDPNGQRVQYLFKDMRLKTMDPNNIVVHVLNSNGDKVKSYPYAQPDCSLFAQSRLRQSGEFKVPKDFLSLIEGVAQEKETNPSFLAGVVAQESGFNPKAVSWAKAIGLTQITPLAEKQMMNQVGEWPRHPGINSLSYLSLKSKIYLGEIDQQSEWRLDPKRSLIGGLTYFNYLKRYWRLNANSQLVDSLKGDREQVLTDLILASYNSGASRVKRAVVQKGDSWKDHKSLKEAVHYLKRVNSYCYHFSTKEVVNDGET